MKTAMQDLRLDLQETINGAKYALSEIENDGIRFACQEVVRLTIQNVIKRIDEELLETEKQRIIDDFDNGQANYTSPRDYETGEDYYNETFKPL